MGRRFEAEEPSKADFDVSFLSRKTFVIMVM